MKPFIIIFLLLFSSAAYIQSQNTMGYKYDASGNRTDRVINLSLKSAAEAENATSIDDRVSGNEIKIYPNPTRGELFVEIADPVDIKKGEVTLFDMSGKMLGKQNISSDKIYFDLSNHPSGMYIMTIRINDEVTQWKILKE